MLKIIKIENSGLDNKVMDLIDCFNKIKLAFSNNSTKRSINMLTLKSSANKADMEAAFKALTGENIADHYMALSGATRQAVEKVIHVGIGSLDSGPGVVEDLGLFLSSQLEQSESVGL